MNVNIVGRGMISIGKFISSGETSFGSEMFWRLLLRRADPASDKKRPRALENSEPCGLPGRSVERRRDGMWVHHRFLPLSYVVHGRGAMKLA